MVSISIIIPFFNEEAHLMKSVNSLLSQTYAPNQLILVDDGSTDNSAEIASSLQDKFSFISFISSKSTSAHQPGQKVIHAFNRGLSALSSPWDIICKFDADIIFPPHYLETVANSFLQNDTLGMFSGVLTVQKNGSWELENIATAHVRGPVKAYSNACFKAIGGLRPALGWDTIDVMLARYHGFDVEVDDTLIVKHLRPTGFQYSQSAAKAKGEVFYVLGYGFFLGIIASIKWSIKQRGSLTGVLLGFFGAVFKNKPKLVSKEEIKFIRKYRWSQIRSRFIG